MATGAALATGLGMLSLPAQAQAADYDDLLTDHVVAVNETVSDAGFVHPGVGLTADDLRNAQEMARAGQEPWASYFAAMADTSFASTTYRASNSKSAAEPDAPLDPTFVQVGMRNRETNDSFGALTQALMWTITGDEVYRRNAIQALRTWANMDPTKYAYFADAHIHTGHPLYQFLMAAEIIRATEPVDDDTPGEYGGYDVVWSEEDDADLLTNFADPVVETFLFSNERWMNQHNFGLFGRIATAIYADDADAYATGVEWFTVNSGDTAYDNGALAPLLPLIDADDPLNPYGTDFVQMREMGRDQAHGECNIDNFTGLARMLEVQGTTVDPTAGTVSDDSDAVSAYDFLDQRLLDGADAFYGFMMGAPTPWIDETGQGVTIAQAYRGRLFNPVNELYYEYALERGVDVAAEAPYLAELSDRMTGPYYWYGTGVANFWAPGDKNPEYWVAFPESLAGTEPAPLPETPQLSFADAGLALDAGTELVTEDGATFARASLSEDGTTSVVGRMMYGANARIGLRFRSDGPADLEVLYKEEASGLNPDEAPTRTLAALELPDTGGEWRYVTYPAGGQNVNFYRLTGAEGTTVDLDSVTLSGATDLTAPVFNSTQDAYFLTARDEAVIDLSATDAEGTVAYSVDGLPRGADFNAATGVLTWEPAKRETRTYEIQVVADDGESVAARTVELVVSPNRKQTVDNAVKHGTDRRTEYTTVTHEPFEAARDAAKDAARHGTEAEFNDAMAVLLDAIKALVPLNPQLADDTFDYSDAVTPSGINAAAVDALADGDNTSHHGDLRSGSFTLDFGTQYRISAESFAFQARSLFPNRSQGTNVYGSIDGVTWELLTERPTTETSRWESIPVVAEHAGEAYRYLKVQLDEPGIPTDPAYPGIWSIGEFRIGGERSEVPGTITTATVASPDALAGRVTAGDTVNVAFTSPTAITGVSASLAGQPLTVASEDGRNWTATGVLGDLDGGGALDLAIEHTTADGTAAATVHGSTDGTALYGSDERNLVDLSAAQVVTAAGEPDTAKAPHSAAMLDGNAATFSDVPAVDGKSTLIWDFGDGAGLTLDRADFLARQDNNGMIRMADLVLEGSNDLDSWTRLTDPTVKTLSWQGLDAEGAEGYRYLRVSNGALIDIAELRVFGSLDLDLDTITARAEAVDLEAHSRASAILFARELDAVKTAADAEGADETALARRLLDAWGLLEDPAVTEAATVDASWVVASTASWDGTKNAAANGWALFDGDTATYTDTTTASGWVRVLPGADTAFTVETVRFHPRSTHVSRAVGVQFQGSNDGGATWTTFATATTASAGWNTIDLAAAVEYGALRVNAPSGNTNLAEVEFLVEVADRTGLELLLDETADLAEADWTPTSWTALTAARDTAAAVGADAAQADVDAAAEALAAAIEGLEQA
ncbi:putative Ig domain-containing protein [Glycomyces sp. NPDC047010]|uniref:putative Ig domain-containing protein n=1 Tax=Glycomyces sp. NPDC047010 TaxID=3155023 RepID=UPI0033CFAC05